MAVFTLSSRRDFGFTLCLNWCLGAFSPSVGLCDDLGIMFWRQCAQGVDIMSTFFQAFCQADPLGRVIFFALIALSVVSWFFLVYKIYDLMQIKRCAELLMRGIKSQKKSFLGLTVPDIVRPKRGARFEPFSDLYLLVRKKTVEMLDKNNSHVRAAENYLSRTDVELLSSYMEATLVTKRTMLEKHLFILPTTITLAPFLGLLGTVWGILTTFGELQAGHSALSNSVVLGGLSTALTTTALGLFIAIPSLVGYSYIKNLNRHFFAQMQEFGHFLLSTVELQYRKVDVE